MKTPVSPPNFDDLLRSIMESEADLIFQFMQNSSPVDSKGRYLYWDKLRHLPLENNNLKNSE